MASDTNRWWTYQRERFPVLLHGPLVATFSASAVCCSMLLRGRVAVPSHTVLMVSFVSALLFFLQLRIADEFKDAEDDAQFRPYLPVPRGLVRLRELAYILIGTIAIQVTAACFIEWSLLLPLAVVWTILSLMSMEFFVAQWIRNRPAIYMLSHMIILPAIDFYTSACDWWVNSAQAPVGLNWFLAVSYLNGIVIEIGRKIRSPDAEELGVDTYSSAWGHRRATWIWLGALVVTGLVSVRAARFLAFQQVVLPLVLLLIGIAAALGIRFVRSPSLRRSKYLEVLAGVWTLLLYLNLGVIPLVYRCWTEGRK